MKKNEYGGSYGTLLASISIIGTALLLINPDLITGFWEILVWSGIVISAVFAFVFFKKDQEKKREAEKQEELRLRKKSRNAKKQREKQEKQIEVAREKLIKQEEKENEKIEDRKKKFVKDEKFVWDGRINEAKDKEGFFKSIIQKSQHMPVRNAAGKAAFEWNEALSVAQWTIQQVDMFEQRPSVTNKAREEAREAIIESIRVKQAGANWTKEKGQELADKKEKAQQEIQIEEDRLKAIKNEVDNAAIKWRAAEMRAKRWQDELEKIHPSAVKK